MNGANDCEVPPIEGGDAMDAEALGDGDDRRVGTAEAKVGIALGEVGHTSDVSVGQLGQLQATRPEVAQEPDLGGRAAPLAEEVTDLGDRGGGDRSRFIKRLEEPRCGGSYLRSWRRRRRRWCPGGSLVAEAPLEVVVGPGEEVVGAPMRRADEVQLAGRRPLDGITRLLR